MSDTLSQLRNQISDVRHLVVMVLVINSVLLVVILWLVIQQK